MDLGLRGKKALVTGSTKGLGRAIVETLLAEGASVAICARNADEVKPRWTSCRRRGHRRRLGGRRRRLGSLTAWIDHRPNSSAASTSTCTTPRASRQKISTTGSNNFEIDLMALVGGVDCGEGRPGRRRRCAHQHRHHRGRRALRLGSGSYSAFKAAVTTGRSARPRCSAPRAFAATSCRPGPILIDGGDWDMIKTACPSSTRRPRRAIPAGQLGTAAGRRQRRRVPRQRRGQAHQRREPHRRRRLPQAHRLLEPTPDGDRSPARSTPTSWPAASITTSTSPGRSCSSCWPSTTQVRVRGARRLRGPRRHRPVRRPRELHLRCPPDRSGPAAIRTWVEAGGAGWPCTAPTPRSTFPAPTASRRPAASRVGRHARLPVHRPSADSARIRSRSPTPRSLARRGHRAVRHRRRAVPVEYHDRDSLDAAPAHPLARGGTRVRRARLDERRPRAPRDVPSPSR